MVRIFGFRPLWFTFLGACDVAKIPVFENVIMRHSYVAILALTWGTLALAPGAIAQTAPDDDGGFPPGTSQATIDVPFEGEVERACSFDIPTPGTLVPVDLPIPQLLTSLEAGGNPGQVNLLCNAESSLTVNEPVQVGGPSIPTTGEESFVDSPFGDIRSGGPPLTIPGGTAIPLVVDMNVRADNGATGFPPGVYRYRVTLVVIP